MTPPHLHSSLTLCVLACIRKLASMIFTIDSPLCQTVQRMQDAAVL